MSNQNDPFESLKSGPVPGPSASAREKALAASLAAFDAAQADAAKKNAKPAQGSGWLDRLKSIFTAKEGTWTMDIRIPLGTAAVALLLLPLGYQLYSSTSMTPPVVAPQPASNAAPQTAEVPAPEPADARRDAAAAPAEPAATVAAPFQDSEALEAASGDGDGGHVITNHSNLGDGASISAGLESEAPLTTIEPSSLPDASFLTEESQASGGAMMKQAAPVGMAAPPAANFSMDSVAMAPAPRTEMLAKPSIMPQTSTQPTGDEFTPFAESPVKVVKDEPVSTFSIDVDTASYSYVRRSLADGFMPEPDAVRIEELINYFSYDYPAPDSAETPFKPTVSVIPAPWDPKKQVLQIGIKGFVPPAEAHKPANLVFLIDTSGSMDEPDKLPLLKRAFGLLVDTLRPEDTVSIVTYAGSAGTALEPTKAADKAKILGALDNLYAGGSTAGAEGIELAYRLAEQSKVAGGVNRVILATDGDFNVGINDPEDLTTFIKAKRESGVFLSVLGFGRGNLDDATMQALAQNGNGNAAYIDNFREAQKVLVAEGGGTLETIAKDVKIQVEFNPAFISEYRLIGYETRALNREDFNNDKVDAGEIGAGHTVTALYEITPVGSGAERMDPLRYGTPEAAPGDTGSELAFLKMRYKAPDGDVSKLIEVPIGKDMVAPSLSEASADARWAAAVAAFGQKLKGSNYDEMSWEAIQALAQGARGTDEEGYRAEFIQLIKDAKVLDPDKACSAPEGNRNCN